MNAARSSITSLTTRPTTKCHVQENLNLHLLDPQVKRRSSAEYALLMCVRAAAKAISLMWVHLSVRPHETTRLPLDFFVWKSILGTSTKNCRENSNLAKMGRKCQALGMKTSVVCNCRIVPQREKSLRYNPLRKSEHISY
jgi:hypothetical protein